MTWEQWTKEYPAQTVEMPPKHHLGEYDDRVIAEKARDWHEQISEFAAIVVEYKQRFFVVWAGG